MEQAFNFLANMKGMWKLRVAGGADQFRPIGKYDIRETLTDFNNVLKIR
jgi:hypothetical protein